ncbi:dihydrolipoyl dehydrogenase family protein [Nocardioides nematodiphilus]|uniref:dihydrolipoyl dehydrogenase family protein n=1 Tax=Nocardioides nematodiphilus TaxID=2849669 RepID=UPI001CD9A817|nr:NAD(P)/FAD-dependent oxidoreductase [Nocardioides nematodiphilus]MCA1981321.1 NAD(P)/FAD-dependent oxidoreductase [Nocardioides nematodiphilus]
MDADLVVIGTGPGGETLANRAATAGLKVIVVEKHLVGGECPYYGCIPSKMMLRAAHALTEAHRAGELAGTVTIEPSFAPVAKRVAEQATDHWDDTVAVRRLEDAGATVIHGTGRLDGTRRAVITPADGSAEITVEARIGVVLNPGTRPAAPPIDGLEGTPYWTNREALQATEAPAELIVIGGGPIGCELAQVFSSFGTRVTIVQRGPRLLPADEPEASAVLAKAFAEEGVRVLTDAESTSVSYEDGRFTLTLADGQTATGDRLLVAAGRTQNTDGLGLESVGIDPRAIAVDEWMRAGGDDAGLWIIGDVTGHGAFTHMSMYQADIAFRSITGAGGFTAEYHAVPHATFTDPEVGGVGLTEAAARAAGLAVRTGSADLGASSRGFTHGPGAVGLIKLVEADGVLVGATAVGPAGGEILGLLALAVHARIPTTTLASMIYAYPTFHRTISSAIDDLHS